MKFCLPKAIADHFIENLKDGTLDLEKLSKMGSSEERRAYIAEFVGNAPSKEVTALFESKLLQKNQEAGMISFIKEVAGLRPTVEKDLISRINKLGRVLTPEEKSAFLQDFVSKKLGTETSFEDAKTISDLSKAFQEAKANPNSGETYGATKVALSNFMNDLKIANEKVGIKQTLGNFKSNPVGTATQQISNLAGFAKGIKASLDDSAIFRQGWKTLFTNPKQWAEEATNSFTNIYKVLSGKASAKELLDAGIAHIQSMPLARDGTFDRMGLDIGNLEESFPTSLPEKIPGFGRLYSASETAYKLFLYNMRAKIANQMVEKAVSSGVDMSIPLQAKSIGTLVNSLTGRGNLGSLERVGKQINTIFFSPKMLKSSFDFLTLHAADEMSGFARKQAAVNLAKVLSGITTILGTAYALDPKSVETDPRSADFGKIRVGDTRFDVSGGMSSLVTLAMREITQSSKSSTTHKVTPLNSGKFGSQTGMDVLVNFGENKLAPMAALMKDLVNQQTFEGTKPTVGGEAANLLLPLGLQNAWEVLHNPNGANAAATIIADGLGISTNTYKRKK